MKKIFTHIVAVALFCLSAVSFTVAFVHAQTTQTQPAAVQDLDKKVIKFDNKTTDDVQGYIQRIVNVMFSLIAALAVIFIIVGGFRLAASGGNQDNVKKGKATITWAIAGLATSILAFALVRIILNLVY